MESTHLKVRKSSHRLRQTGQTGRKSLFFTSFDLISVSSKILAGESIKLPSFELLVSLIAFDSSSNGFEKAHRGLCRVYNI